ncbi:MULTISPECIES: SPFH domain-containing protein [Mameliella]|uniref:Antifreeze protein, type I n=1 Tax=Mameliella alba TaxID=561184 RepID=A0A0B3SRV7_9RHOB|nr:MULTISPECIES: SPFH domain-containing protein [Mameliella]ODM50160.1 antifreeze protein [Ruegeria sp. PBVC088]KHQ53204.1 Antifreeze protein, type I [Mameliella alba]MBY6121699.1 SPFH domain-containing protein [Mameliella alba]MDD9728337.1 SPFH domain-containing protein [Mameliella sp. AT18]OWV40531.1 antifreeze protein [Mameliella alba]
MGIWDFLSGQFIDVIHWTDDTRDTMVWRFEREGHEIKYGAKLTVREGQAAVFVHEGQLADVFTPGLYMLETNNMPIMTSLQHWDHAFQSPFKSEVYFVNTNRFTNLKWGTKNPIMLRDPEFGPTRIRAFGTYSIKVADPALFMTEIVGTDGEFTMDEISFQIRNIIVQEFSKDISASGIPVLDMAANTGEVAELIRKAIDPVIHQYGLELAELYIENISLPEAVEKALDARTSRGIAGNLDDHMKWKAAEAMGQGGAMDQSMGMGFGAGMGMQMANAMGQQGPWGAAPQQQGRPQPAAAPMAPPPPPVEHVWHLAKNGQTSGPYSKADLGKMVASGELTRETHAWTQGQDGWKRAGEVPELAQLFTVMPPPPPPM